MRPRAHKVLSPYEKLKNYFFGINWVFADILLLIFYFTSESIHRITFSCSSQSQSLKKPKYTLLIFKSKNTCFEFFRKQFEFRIEIEKPKYEGRKKWA